MQNAQKIHRSRKKIARMSRGGVVREITLGLRTVSTRNLKKVSYIFPSTIFVFMEENHSCHCRAE